MGCTSGAEGSEAESDEDEDELDSNAGDELDLVEEVDPYDREEALRLTRTLKEEEAMAKIEDEENTSVPEKRSALEDLIHESRRQRLSLISKEE